MTRRSLVQQATVMLAGGSMLSACQAPGSEAPMAEDTREVTVSYITDFSGGARGEWIRLAIPKFMQEHPKIKVQVDNLSGDVQVVTLANAAAGTLQDTMLGANDVMHKLARAGDMKDITPALRSLRIKMEDLMYVPSTIQYEGKQYGLPFQFNVVALMINKTMFVQKGVPLPDDKTTYPQLLEMVQRIARPSEDIYGYLPADAWNHWMPFVWGWGGDRWTPDLKKTLLDQPASVEGLQFYVDMMHRHRVAAPLDPAGRTPNGVGFVNGNVAIAARSSPGRDIHAQVGGKFDWDIMWSPIGPKVNKRNLSANDQSNFVTGMAAKRNVFDQAVRFITWCSTSKTAQDLIVETGATMPVLRSVLNGPAYVAGPPPGIKTFVAQHASYRDPQIFIGWSEWRDAVTAALKPGFANEKAVRDAAADATRAGDLVLAKIPK